MHTIVIEPDLYKRIEKAALENKANIDEILDQSIRHYW